MIALLAVLVTGTAQADPTLSVSGACPGPVDISVSGATPGGFVAFLRGIGPGSNVVPAGPCAGTVTGLAGARMIFRIPSPDGSFDFSPTLPGGICGDSIQVLDTATCTLSAAVALAGGDAGDPRAFGTCGQVGSSGPDQLMCDADYAGTSLEGEVTVVDGIQFWTAPASATYRIAVMGAQAGSSEEGAQGMGAHVEGDFSLSAGDTLKILVGQMGSSGTTYDYGGGGGSFVALDDDTPLIVAGGGGTTGNCGAGIVTAAQGGKAAEGDGFGGVSGNDGTWCGCGGDGSPGGGFFTDGSADASGQAFINGGLGAVGVRPGQCIDAGIGGFGGGGNSGNGGAGGGGYGGGIGGGSGSPDHHGLGGTSYNAGLDPFGADAANEGDGSVTITPL